MNEQQQSPPRRSRRRLLCGVPVHCGVSNFLLILMMVMTVVSNAQEGTPTNLDQPPLNKWTIGQPSFRTERLDLFLTFPLSDFIPYEHVEYTFYTDCNGVGTTAQEITENPGYFLFESAVDDETLPEGDGSAWRFTTVSMFFDSESIRTAPIFTGSNANGEETISFCVLASAYSAPPIVPGALAIFEKLTTIDLTITQDGQFGEEIDVTTGNQNEEEERIAYLLRGFLCDQDNIEIIDPIPIYQGTPVKVCVTPLDNALADGVYMRAIDSFSWTRETIYQSAIVPNQVAAPLTAIDCVPGMITCSFITLLKADFFYKLGRVYGAGIGWLQFGRGEYTGDKRVLKAGIQIHTSSILQAMDEQQHNHTITTTQQHQRDLQIALPRPPDATYPEYAGAGPFNVDLPVTRLYRAYGWLCDKDNNRLDEWANPIVKGDIARVCVTPDDIAINQDNVRIRLIDNFAWYREDAVVNITQPAITTNAVAEDRTEIFCVPGSLVCALETDLVDGFFAVPGPIQGRGVVWLQFGDDPGGRLLQIPLEIDTRPPPSSNRGLQYSLEDYAFGAQFLPIADPGFAGASPFQVILYLLPPVAERELYRCRAYECDYQNKEFVSNDPKEEGDSIRMCVRPSRAAELVGAKMWSVEWWTWTQVDLIQEAIVMQGKEAPDGRTVNFCERYMEVCFFQTNLIPMFFAPPQPNAINGDGVCWITFGNNYAIPAPIEYEDTQQTVVEIDPTMDPLYAGHNPISIIFPTIGDYEEVKEICPPEDHTLTGWWDEQDDTMQLVYIGLMVLAGLSCCIPWFCMLGCICRRRQKDKTTIEEKHGNILVNVDVDQNQQTNSNEELRSEDNYEETVVGLKGVGFDGKRKAEDIDLDDYQHPGTENLRKKIRSYLKKNEDAEYGPEPYQYFRRKFSDCYFLVQKGKKKWREAKKSEAVAGIGEIWKEERKELKAKKEEYTKKDIKRVESQRSLESLDGDKESSRPRRRSSRRSLHDDDESTGRRRRSSSRKSLDGDAESSRHGRRSGSRSSFDEEKGQSSRRRRNSKRSLGGSDEEDEGRRRPSSRRSSKSSLRDY